MFFIKEDNVRSGNRGGRSNFKWEDIRLLNYKERECYIGATPKLGFLDKGGKWRKRDWWVKFDSLSDKDKEILRAEKDSIRREEERILQESLGITSKNKEKDKKEQLTDYEWSAMMKKEHKFNPDDPKLFEFYDDEDHKRGLGMKQQISFKTNPFDSKVMSNLSKLPGREIENEDNQEEDKKKSNIDYSNPYLKAEAQMNYDDRIIDKQIKKYYESKKKLSTDKSSSKSRSRSRRKHKKEKKHEKKREKKEKKDKSEKKHKKHRHS